MSEKNKLKKPKLNKLQSAGALKLATPAESKIKKISTKVLETGAKTLKVGGKIVRTTGKTAKLSGKVTHKIGKIDNAFGKAEATEDAAANLVGLAAKGSLKVAGKQAVIKPLKTVNKNIQLKLKGAMTDGVKKRILKVDPAKVGLKNESWTTQVSAKMSAWGKKQAAKAAKKGAKKAVQASGKAAKMAAKASAKAAAYTAKGAAAAGKVAVKLGAALIKGLIALLSTFGGFFFLIAIVIAVVIFAASSIFGLQYAVDEDGNPDVLAAEVTTLTDAYYMKGNDALQALIVENTVNETQPDIVFEGAGVPADGGELFYVTNLHDVLSVYTMRAGSSEEESLTVVTDSRKELLAQTFWDMNDISVTLNSVEEISEEVPDDSADTTDEETTTEVTKKIIHVSISKKSLSYIEAADLYNFDADERTALGEHMTEEAYAYISSIIGQSPTGGTLADAIKINPNMPTSEIGSTIVLNAQRYLGRSYASMDCSALVRAAYGDSGISWGGTSTTMAKECVTMGVVIDKSQLQPGDLVFWQSIDPARGKPYCGNSRCSGACSRWNMIHHVAIYAGNGQVIESVSKGVSINNLWETNKWKIAFYARPYVSGN